MSSRTQESPAVELRQIELPEFGEATIEPEIGAGEYAARIDAIRRLAQDAKLDMVLVYGDREHSANLAFLTAYDPRFEEALLVLAAGQRPVLLVGNEGVDYAAVSPLDLAVELYQPFSLLGQDRTRSRTLEEILAGLGMRAGTRVGIVDWKYFESGGEANAADRLYAPSFLVDTVRALTSQPVRNVTAWLMNPADGLRAVNTVDQLAQFEFAATSISNAMRRVLRALQPGRSEIDMIQAGRLPGLPHSMHPILISGPRTRLALASPSLRKLQHGDAVSCALGVTGALNARAGFLVQTAAELPESIRDYVDRLVKPYFAAVAEWYGTVGIGVPGGELYALIQRHLGDPFFGVGLNPGHLIHLDEWVHSPIYAGSRIELQSGMALQVDVIPATHSPYFTTNIEDGIALADDALRRDFAARWPEAWGRIQARRRFIQEQLGISLKPEVLPFSNLAAHLTPYMLAPDLALACA